MPIIQKPAARSPLFGGRSQIVIGGPLARQLRDEKLAKASTAGKRTERGTLREE